jgi:hypothetical protein
MAILQEVDILVQRIRRSPVPEIIINRDGRREYI